jgi:hypothetical protein
MLDRRAWIVTCLIVLLAAGAYLLWLTRARAVQNSRSLSAAPPPANGAQGKTKSLHVEGCKDDFIVEPGELVEPRVVPGASLEQFRTVYGPESKKEAKRKEPRVLAWTGFAYSLTEGNFGVDNPQNFVQVQLNQGHVVETLDGIELGLDSFGTIFRKMRDRKIEVHERIDGAEGNWTLIVSLYSSCGRKFRSEYSRTLPGSPELDRLIEPRTGADGRMGLFRSDAFMNKVVSDYTMVPSEGHDESDEGQPSEHE